MNNGQCIYILFVRTCTYSQTSHNVPICSPEFLPIKKNLIMTIQLCLHIQLGFESKYSRTGRGPESVKQSVFSPTLVETLMHIPEASKPSKDKVQGHVTGCS